MKNKPLINKLAFLLILGFVGAFVSCEKGQLTPTPATETQTEPSGINLRQSSEGVDPVLFNPWQSGNASFECAQAGGCGDFALKIDNWDGIGEDGGYSDPNAQPGTAAANVITITGSDAQTFSWSSDYEVCAVIVKGGPAAYVYYYPDGSCGDVGLYAPINPNNGKNYGISHVTFCWNDTDCGEDPNACYEEETAWAAGSRYTNRGNWATYTPYPGDGNTVDIYAGRNKLAGSATFDDLGNGTVEISIDLVGSFVFYYGSGDLTNDDDNLKVQDYSSAPSGNPAPGLFAHKKSILVGSTSGSIIVPLNNFYGIHLDVAYEVPCE